MLEGARSRGRERLEAQRPKPRALADRGQMGDGLQARDSPTGGSLAPSGHGGAGPDSQHERTDGWASSAGLRRGFDSLEATQRGRASTVRARASALRFVEKRRALSLEPSSKASGPPRLRPCYCPPGPEGRARSRRGPSERENLGMAISIVFRAVGLRGRASPHSWDGSIRERHACARLADNDAPKAGPGLAMGACDH